MAGLLQTGTLVDGQWTTTNVDINTVLERHNERKQDESQSEHEKPPIFGLLTQSVIESSTIQWILTAQIRSPEHHDVIFIGDQTVQIHYFGSEGQLHGVARGPKFSSRIRNVGVIDLRTVEHTAKRDVVLDFYVKKEDGDTQMPDTLATKLPPQLLVLALESGELVFLYASGLGTTVDFIASRHRVATPMLSGEPGTHLTCDPSSRYMAIGTRGSMGIFALRSKEELAAEQARGDSVYLISSERYIPIHGVILHMKFLFPAPNDPDHMILLLLVANSGSTAMLVYEWEAGQDLLTLRSNNIGGHKLHPSYRMPLLVIPLTIKSAFLLVFPESITECTNILLGPPDYLDLPIEEFEASEDHLGIDLPLWVSWTRSSLAQRNQITHDEIYIAREDGAILFVKISNQDSGGYAKAQAAAGSLDCRIGTAFASLRLPLHDSDFLAVAGDACNGGVYLVEAGGNLVKTDSIANWSPMIDFVTTSRTPRDEDLSHDAFEPQKKRRLAVDEPDKIYVCTGRGSHGAVSEMRYGHEARIRFDTPGLDFTTRETWLLPVGLEDVVYSPSSLFSPSSFLLMSAGSGSVLLHIAADTNGIEEIDQDKTWLDLDSRTLAAAACNGAYVQITERSILASGHPPYFESATPVICRENQAQPNVIIAAGIYEAEFVVIVTQDEDYNLQVSGLHVRNGTTTEGLILGPSLASPVTVEPLIGSFPLSGYPNSISIIRQSVDNLYAIVCAGGLDGNRSLGLYPTTNTSSQLSIFEIKNGRELVEIDPRAYKWPLFECGLPDALLEVCVDIVKLGEVERHPKQPELVLAGYRSGLLIMRRYKRSPDGGIRELSVSRYLMGSTAVTFKSDPTSSNAAFVRCDSKLWRVVYDSYSHADPVLNRLWFTAAEEPLHNQPPVDTVSILSHRLLLTSGKRLLIASVDSETKPIPRTMPVQGAPNRLLYSHHLSKIIVAMAVGGRSTLAFLDPESGKLYNRHHDSFGRMCRFPPGLGNAGERILSFVEWRWKSLDVTHDLLLVGTSEGRLLIYSVEFSDFSKLKLGKDDLHWINHIKEYYGSPVSAIATCKNTMILCVGRTVRWASLDKLKRKRLLIHAEYTLPSSAVSVSVDGHWISILTAKHSLIKLLLVDKRQHPNLSDHHGRLFPQFSDEHSRDSIDQISLSVDQSESTGNDSALVMLADKDCSVTGLWGTKMARTFVTDYETIFEAELRSSILKFRAGRVRPPWDKIYKHGWLTVPSNRAGEVLGISIDGSITNFTLLTEQVWRLLKFLQDLGVASSTGSNSNHWGSKPDPRSKHIDGELLRPFLQYHILDNVLRQEQTCSQSKPDNSVLEEFCNLVRGLENTESIQPKEVTYEDCLQEARQLLADLLRPVI